MTRLVAAVLAALVALVGTASALAYSPPFVPDGVVVGLRADAAPDGSTFVSWQRKNAPPGAAAMDAWGTWSWADPSAAPAQPPQLPEPTAGLEIATDAAGNALAVWRSGDAVRVAGRPAGGTWSAPQTIATEPTHGPAELAVGLGAAGHAVALWTVRVREGVDVQFTERRAIRAADRAPDGTWSAPYDLDPPGDPVERRFCAGCPDTANPPAVTVDPVGNAVAAWTGSVTPAAGGLVWADRALGGAWSAPRLLAAPAGTHLALTTDASGTTVASWQEGGALHVARRHAGQPAFAFVDHLGSVHWDISPSVTADAFGRLLAVWVSGDGRVLARRNTSGGWQEPADLTAIAKPPPPRPQVPTVFIDDPPARLALLQGTPRLSRETLRPPACASRRAPRARRACRGGGTILSFRLSAASVVRVTVQRRGAGRAVRGLSVAAGAGPHRIVVGTRPLPPGRYTVRIRVTAQDRVPEAAAVQLLVRPT